MCDEYELRAGRKLRRDIRTLTCDEGVKVATRCAIERPVGLRIACRSTRAQIATQYTIFASL